MSTALFMIIGVGSIIAFVVASLVRSSAPEPPRVIYVQTVAPQRGGSGCLPFLAGVIITFLVLYLLARP